MTVVDKIPPDNGASVFRPPYVGTYKPMYAINSLQTNLFPTLDPSQIVVRPSVAQVAQRFEGVRLDHIDIIQVRLLHPFDLGVADYGADFASQNNQGALGLMFDDPLPEKNVVDFRVPAACARTKVPEQVILLT